MTTLIVTVKVGGTKENTRIITTGPGGTVNGVVILMDIVIGYGDEIPGS